MATDHPHPDAEFERLVDLDSEAPTLIEGLPGHGLVASIAVELITDQLGLEHVGTVRSEALPSVLSFEDGRSRDLVRVYGGTDPDVLTLQSDVPIPPAAFDPIGHCAMEDLAGEFERAVFLAGAPAESEDQLGEIVGIATEDGLREDLTAAGVALAEGSGVVGGVTGALAAACHDAGVPAAVLVVRANPYLPDPGAARAVIESALEPLVEFDVDTDPLRERAEEIQRRKQQVAQQLKQQQQQQQQAAADEAGGMRMFQ